MTGKKKRLDKRFYNAYKILQDNSYKQRAQKLENIKEYGYAILLRWNRIEILLKLLRYVYQWDEYPSELNFINKNWGILNRIYNFDKESYNYIIDHKNSNSLWKIRNLIAHTSYQIDDINVYEKYKKQADIFYNLLEENRLTKEEYTSRYNRRRKK